MRKIGLNGSVLAAAVAVANACGGQSVEQINGDGSGAAGGGVSVGGAAGRGGGTGGAAGRGTAGRSAGGRGVAGRGSAGRGVAGTGTVAGSGGSGGDAGADVGGSTTMAGAGSGNDDPKVIPSNADCHCVVNFDGWFSCTMSLSNAAVTNHATAVCDQLDTLTTRVPCDDGGFAYHWVEGGENDYDLSVDPNGHATYYSAFGYVGSGCGVSSDYPLGSIEAGTASSSCFSEYTCAPCGDEVTDVPHCPVCGPEGPGSDPISETLDDFCSSNVCPANAAAARDYLTRSCTIEPRPTVERGCGIIAVRSELGSSTLAFYYDEQSDELVGVVEHDDVVHGPCNSFTYMAGNVPSATCATATTCAFCTGSGNGAAGAAGEGGSASDACLP